MRLFLVVFKHCEHLVSSIYTKAPIKKSSVFFLCFGGGLLAKLLFLAIQGPKGNVKRCLAGESIDRADAFDCNLGERGKNESRVYCSLGT